MTLETGKTLVEAEAEVLVDQESGEISPEDDESA